MPVQMARQRGPFRHTCGRAIAAQRAPSSSSRPPTRRTPSPGLPACGPGQAAEGMGSGPLLEGNGQEVAAAAGALVSPFPLRCPAHAFCCLDHHASGPGLWVWVGGRNLLPRAQSRRGGCVDGRGWVGGGWGRVLQARARALRLDAATVRPAVCLPACLPACRPTGWPWRSASTWASPAPRPVTWRARPWRRRSAKRWAGGRAGERGGVGLARPAAHSTAQRNALLTLQ